MKCLLACILSILSASVFGQLQSPDEFLPHKLGEHFTPHHYLVDYFEHVAEESPLVQMEHYGSTNQDRPLMVAYVSSAENLARLETVRRQNLSLAGIEEFSADEKPLTIVWLSFSVHGNESAGTESSYEVLHALADPNNRETKKWLENTLVIIDPCLNPDGYSRYVHWVRNWAGQATNTNLSDIEHDEPWPGGRMNHYLFDLNRDWAWQTQKESRHRMALYNSWLPHVHADLHEMGRNSPYYFAPAARPYHNYISKWQRDFQYTIGKNHAKYFDKEGWLYFTREVFDLFYPSYGDTYPTFSGAIGMTYEQGGSGTAGRAVKKSNGEILTLRDRINHHRTTALSTIEISSQNHQALIDNFKQFFHDAVNNPKGKYRGYVVKANGYENRVDRLRQLLDRQKIRYNTVSDTRTVSGYDYYNHTSASVSVEPGDLVLSAHQPRSTLLQVLMDPQSSLEDSLTYDITAWSLPYAYGLEAFALTKDMEAGASFKTEKNRLSIDKDAYAYVLPWTSLSSAQALSKIQAAGVKTRVASDDFQIGEDKFSRGSIIVNRGDNMSMKDELRAVLEDLEKDSPIDIETVESGFSVNGPDLGSYKMSLLENVNALTVMGSGVSPYSFGQIRYFFEQEIDYPLTVTDVSKLKRMDLSEFNVLILPDGWYSMGDDVRSKISSWVSGGGKLIAIAGANRALADKEGFGLKSKERSKSKDADSKKSRLIPFQGSDRRRISGQIPGAIIKTKMDSSHPLSYGLGDQYYSLKTNSLHYPLLEDGWNVGHVPDETEILGFVGSEIKEDIKGSISYAVENKGSGSIIYMIDNPLFRSFWDQGKFLFSNALFF